MNKTGISVLFYNAFCFTTTYPHHRRWSFDGGMVLPIMIKLAYLPTGITKEPCNHRSFKIALLEHRIIVVLIQNKFGLFA